MALNVEGTTKYMIHPYTNNTQVVIQKYMTIMLSMQDQVDLKSDRDSNKITNACILIDSVKHITINHFKKFFTILTRYQKPFRPVIRPVEQFNMAYD